MIVIVLLGGGVGLLSGMFGVGGGFLTTPLLIFYGIPADRRRRERFGDADHRRERLGRARAGARRGGVDYPHGRGDGSPAASPDRGSARCCSGCSRRSGQIDTDDRGHLCRCCSARSALLMARESIAALIVAARARAHAAQRATRRHHPLISMAAAALALLPVGPLHLAASGRSCSGMLTGALTVIARRRRRVRHGAGDDLPTRHGDAAS